MKKMKKIFTILSAMIMIIAMATGCAKKNTEKPVDSNTANGISTKTSLKLKTESANLPVILDLSITSNMSEKDASVSITGDVNAGKSKINLKADNLFVVANDKFYVNVKAVLDAISGVEATNEAITPIKEKIKEDYVYIDIAGISEAIQTVDTKTGAELIDSLMAAYKDISSGTDEKTVVKIKTFEELKAFSEATSKYLKDNADKIAEYIISSYNKVDVNKIIDSIVDTVANSMVEAYKEIGMEVTEEQKSQMKEAMSAEIDTSAFEIKKEDVINGINTLAENFIISIDEENTDLGDTTFEAVIEKVSSGYKIAITAKNGDNSFELTSEVDAKSSVSVSAPSKAQNVGEIITSLIATTETTEE